MIKSNKIIDFVLPAEITLAEVIDSILQKNGLEENLEDYFTDETIKNREPKVIIIRDAALVLVEKKISEEKLAEFLARHLETSKETAEKVVADIKQQLIPYAKVIDLKEEKEMERKSTVPSSEKGEPLPLVKKVEVTDVEKNAKKLREERIKKFGGDKFTNEKKGLDSYREPIE